MAATVLFVLSSLIMATTVQAQDCPKPEGGPNITLRDEDIVKKTFPDKQRIRLRCGIGYTSAGGSPYITCLAGSWSPVQLKCERKNCGSAGEVANARINYDGTEFGDKAEIRCNKGYTMVGKGVLNCGDKGWMGRLPVCEGIKCFPSPVIANGYLRPDREAYNYRQVVKYFCDKYYTLEGAREGICSENGEFNPKPPICKPKDCSRPGGGSYMHLKGNDNRKYTFPHNSTVTFECNEGFNDEGGSPLSTCTAGRWSPVELRCELKDCGPPKNVVNGHINYERTEYDDKATIRCNHGYKLIGNSEITCKMMGWSEPPTCQVVTCVSPPVVANGSFTPVKDVYRYEDSVVYSCDDGYKLLGSETLKCINNDTFLPHPPQCKSKDCYRPGGGSNMHLKGNDNRKYTFPHDSTVIFECNEGFNDEGGSPLSTCTAGHWSPVELRCEIKNCGPPKNVVNGKINYKWTEYDDKATIRCDHGYKLIGNSEITCKMMGWSEPPTCQVVTCVSPPVVANGSFTPVKDVYRYEDSVVYSCDDGYKLLGSETLKCINNDTFLPHPPQCEPKDCSRPGGGSYMHLKGNDNRKNTFPHDSTVIFECNEGFNDEGGSPLSTCTAGRWSPVELRCEIKNCGPPENMTNGHRNYERTEYNDKATIRCDHGYKLIGNSEITCKMMGWSEPPTCQVVTCVSPPVVANGGFTPVKDVYRYEDSVVYSCDDGYKLLGSETLKCINNDTFLPDPPQCELKNCGPPKNVTNGHINYEWTEYDDKATIRCDHGYKLIGNSEITCKMMGWSEPLTCQVVTCVSPPVVANGSFTPVKDVYRYEDSVVYSCDDGYKLLGSETLKCINNDTFLPKPPQCERQDEDRIFSRAWAAVPLWYTLLRWSSLASLLVILL